MTAQHLPEHPYTSRVIKGGALLSECRALLRAWRPDESAADLAARVLAQDLLGRNTAQRVHDLVRLVFARRYLADPANARLLQRLLQDRPRGEWFAQVSLVLAARSDGLVREVASIVVPRLRRQGTAALSARDLVPFLREAEQQGRTQRPWSPAVRQRVSQGLVRLLTELGLLGPPRRGLRELLPCAPHQLSVAWLAYDLHFQGVTDSGVTAHPDWRLWQLDEEAVRRELSDLAPQGLWIFQAAGSVVDLRWNHSNREELADVLVGLDLL